MSQVINSMREKNSSIFLSHHSKLVRQFSDGTRTNSQIRSRGISEDPQNESLTRAPSADEFVCIEIKYNKPQLVSFPKIALLPI